MEATLRILPYIEGSLGRCLLYKENGHLRFEAYSDSGYARDKREKNLRLFIVPMEEEIL